MYNIVYVVLMCYIRMHSKCEYPLAVGPQPIPADL